MAQWHCCTAPGDQVQSCLSVLCVHKMHVLSSAWGVEDAQVNGTAVERFNWLRFLGLHIFKDLSWAKHIDMITKKTSMPLFPKKIEEIQ